MHNVSLARRIDLIEISIEILHPDILRMQRFLKARVQDDKKDVD